MRIVEPSATIITPIDPEAVMRHLELCARVCYKSEGGVCDGSADRLVRHILSYGHESPIEHYSVSVRVVCDRGVSHEWVRHRIASYSQESTRYCNYSKDKFGGEIAFILPSGLIYGSEEFNVWHKAMQLAETAYLELLDMGIPPETARSVLPNSLKTELVCTMNLREWRHFFSLRASSAAHPDMRKIAFPLYNDFLRLLPAVFEGVAG